MRNWIVELGRFLLWIGIGVLAATLYGILNDQITVTLSPEYFSVYKRAQFAFVLDQGLWRNAPTRIQSMLVGTLATWWFGLILGIVLSLFGMVGRRPALSTRDYVHVVLGVMAFSLGLSMAFGLFGYIYAPLMNPLPAYWPFLEGIHAVRPAFAVGFWHDGAYLGGAMGTLSACFWAWRRRRALAKQSTEAVGALRGG